ncbi:MAG: hypothetical protein A2Z88_00695 [Omnitrophica WOR_2 bacterium GWA2_47_8]|nr:MAG: hypothetical protein A2Z88_00695 [Omnitrophica WOR_2 bacterium GWA2_47_8]
MRFRNWTFTLSLLLVLTPCAFARNLHEMNAMAVRSVKAGNKDFAYLYYRSILREFPHSKYAQDALFAVSEYHFLYGDYGQARKYFKEFAEKYPQSPAKIFALAYQFRLAQIFHDQPDQDSLQKAIANFTQVSLVFRDYKEFKYTSAMQRPLRAVYYIDKIEFYAGEDLFAKISY